MILEHGKLQTEVRKPHPNIEQGTERGLHHVICVQLPGAGTERDTDSGFTYILYAIYNVAEPLFQKNVGQGSSGVARSGQGHSRSTVANLKLHTRQKSPCIGVR